MDDLDRLHRRLVHNIRATRPEYLRIPFTVRELYEQIVPYRHNRRELAIETNDDYETAVARLLSGERGYVTSDPAMQEALRRELSSPTGDPGLFKEYADATLTLSHTAETARTPVPESRRLLLQHQWEMTPLCTRTSRTLRVLQSASPRRSTRWRPGTVAPSIVPMPNLLESLGKVDMPTGCRFCGGTLPEGRDVNYCPHCGENLRTSRCSACGAEMDSAWQFCVSCGHRAS